MHPFERTLNYWVLGELTRRHHEPPPGVACGTLTGCELRLFSENGEDGVIAEIMRRIGSSNRYFVEFGAETGQAGNCVFLVDVLGWSGLLMEADPARSEALARKHRSNPRVVTLQAFVTAENINGLLAEARVPQTPDLLSIDIDGNDFWIWAALRDVRPSVIVIEYNAGLDPTSCLVQPYLPNWKWDGTDFFGASLGALRQLGKLKGYRLVHTDLAGVNAFFVRDDLIHYFSDIDLDAVPLRPPNYANQGVGHRPDPDGRSYLDLAQDARPIAMF